MKKLFKLGFIGGGLNSAVGMVHFAACRLDNYFAPVAGCFSRNNDINHQTGDKWGIDKNRIYSSWQELLNKERGHIDAIVVLTPTPTHAEIVVEALKLGYPVICEKSLAMDSTETKAISHLLAQKKGFLSVIYNYSAYPMMKELKSLIEAGELGKIKQIHAEMPQDIFLRSSPQNIQAWRNKDHKVPTVSLDLGIHLHHLIYYLTNQIPSAVVAEEFTDGENSSLVDNVFCMVKYNGGARGLMWFGKTAAGIKNGMRIRVFGEKASAEWYQMNPEELQINLKNGERRIIDRGQANIIVGAAEKYNRFKAGHPIGFVEAFANWYTDLYHELLKYKNGKSQDQNYIYGINIAVDGLKFFEKASNSAKQQSWIKI